MEAFYRQNILVYVKAERLSCYPRLEEALSKTNDAMLDVVHPRTYIGRNSYPMGHLGTLASWIFRRVGGAVKRSFGFG